VHARSIAGSSLFKLLFNAYPGRRGLKYVAKDRVSRITAIANALSKSDYDLVTLQELWVSSDYSIVRKSVQEKLPYSKYFYRYVTLISCLWVTHV
jgi:hypothetical protein